eukprot:9464292-Ditylum_brightwellii.AAC.1
MEQQKLKEAEKEKKKDEQRVYFVIGHTRFWAKLHIARLIKGLAKKFKLTYLHFSMAYRRFTNLQENFLGDLVAKVNDDVELLDFMDHPCNCDRHCFVNGACAYKGNRRKKCIVYKARCKICNKSYVGGTHEHLKAQMMQHFNDVM